MYIISIKLSRDAYLWNRNWAHSAARLFRTRDSKRHPKRPGQPPLQKLFLFGRPALLGLILPQVQQPLRRADRVRPPRLPARYNRLLSDRSDAVECRLKVFPRPEAQDDPRGEILRRETTARRCNITLRRERLLDYRHASLDDHFFVFRSVQAGLPLSSPSLASKSVPEHCDPTG
jgi:hypothetical protein